MDEPPKIISVNFSKTILASTAVRYPKRYMRYDESSAVLTVPEAIVIDEHGNKWVDGEKLKSISKNNTEHLRKALTQNPL